MELDLVIASVELDLFVAKRFVIVVLWRLGGEFVSDPQRVGGVGCCLCLGSSAAV